MFQNRNFTRWFIQGTSGVLLTGAGLCMLVEAGLLKSSQPPVWQWVSFGTIALIVTLTGLNLMIDSIRFRIRYLEERKRPSEKD